MKALNDGGGETHAVFQVTIMFYICDVAANDGPNGEAI